jgi:hypothetical protein
MRSFSCGLLCALTPILIAAGPAQAVVCYVVYDRDNNTIYQNTQTPVDLSDKGLAAREAMSRRGEHLQWAEADRCPTIAAAKGANATSGLSVDEIVGGSQIRTFASANGGPTSGSSVPPGKVPTGFKAPPKSTGSNAPPKY